MSFAGFPRELIYFLSELRKNNDREWFQAHRAEYENFLVEPAREFVVALGDCLSSLGSGIHAEPRVRGSIFAINRDVRFSKDKTPYKTHLDLWFWQGDGPSRERPGYFFRLTPETLTLGAGMHGFSDAQEIPLPAEAFSDQLPGLCFAHYRRVAPLQQWLVDLLAA